MAIELGQLLLPFGRSARLLDATMNAIGAAAGCLVMRQVRRRYGRRALQAKSRTK